MSGCHAAIVTRCDSRADFGACLCCGYSAVGEPFGAYPCSCYSATTGSPFSRRLPLLRIHTRDVEDYLTRIARSRGLLRADSRPPVLHHRRRRPFPATGLHHLSKGLPLVSCRVNVHLCDPMAYVRPVAHASYSICSARAA